MAKATKKSKYGTPDVEPSTSTARPKRGQNHQLQIITGGKKNCLSCSKCTLKVQKTTKKTKKALPSIPKRLSSKKTSTTKKSNKGKKKGLFGHDQKEDGAAPRAQAK